MLSKSSAILMVICSGLALVSAAVDRPRRQTVVDVAQPKYDSGYGGYNSYSNGYGGYGNGGYGGYGGYGMTSGSKDSTLETILSIAIPIGLGLLALPLLFLLLGPILAGLAFFIGRSNDSPQFSLLGMPNLNLIQTVQEAFSAYNALSTDENCRKRVVCELGYILKKSDKRSIIISIIDTMMPKMFRSYFEPLQDALKSHESGSCQKYECDAAAKTLKSSTLKHIFGNDKSSTQQNSNYT